MPGEPLDISGVLSSLPASTRRKVAGLIRAMREVLRAEAPRLAERISDAVLLSWLDGGNSVAVRLPGKPPPFSGVRLPGIQEAANSLMERQILTKEEYATVSRQAQANGFTIAGLATDVAVSQVRDALAEAVVDGSTLRQFQEKVEQKVGKGALSPSKIENTFRTETMRAYNAGQKAVLSKPLVGNHFPFIATLPIRDSRLTELCDVVSKSGIGGSNIFWRDDPVWKRYGNPRHWR